MQDPEPTDAPPTATKEQEKLEDLLLKTDYDLSFFVQPELVSDWMCAICQNVLSAAVTTKCGHLFCSRCLEQSLQQKSKCPVCRTDVTNAWQCAPWFDRKIQEQAVKCIHHQCDWTGKHAQLSEHRAACKQQPIACDDCLAVFPRIQAEQHAKDCPQRPQACTFCRERIKKDDWVQHQNTCFYRPVTCPLRCAQDRLLFSELFNHLDTACANREINCRFSVVGCPVVGTEEEVHHHFLDPIGMAIHHCLLLEAFASPLSSSFASSSSSSSSSSSLSASSSSSLPAARLSPSLHPLAAPPLLLAASEALPALSPSLTPLPHQKRKRPGTQSDRELYPLLESWINGRETPRVKRIRPAKESVKHTGEWCQRIDMEDKFRKTLKIGDLVDAHDTIDWYLSRVIVADPSSIRVHFLGWEAKWDRTFFRDSRQISRPRRFSGAYENRLLRLGKIPKEEEILPYLDLVDTTPSYWTCCGSKRKDSYCVNAAPVPPIEKLSPTA